MSCGVSATHGILVANSKIERGLCIEKFRITLSFTVRNQCQAETMNQLKLAQISSEAKPADWCYIGWTGIHDYRQQVKECERACAEVQRDPATLRRTWFGGCVCAPTEAEVQRLNPVGITSENAFVGTPAQVVEQMRPFVELGVNYFMLSCGGFPDAAGAKV